jgi:hypothetical protein
MSSTAAISDARTILDCFQRKLEEFAVQVRGIPTEITSTTLKESGITEDQIRSISDLSSRISSEWAIILATLRELPGQEVVMCELTKMGESVDRVHRKAQELSADFYFAKSVVQLSSAIEALDKRIKSCRDRGVRGVDSSSASLELCKRELEMLSTPSGITRSATQEASIHALQKRLQELDIDRGGNPATVMGSS